MAAKRRKVRLRYKEERVLFSDVLPYELPVLFSNRYFYRYLLECRVKVRNGKLEYDANMPAGAKQLLYLIFGCKNDNGLRDLKFDTTARSTIPFTYHILHKPTKARALTVIHPANQIEVVCFYEKYKSLILYYCGRDEFSLRHPKKVACYFYYRDRLHNKLLGKKADNIELFFNEYENLKSYFSYGDYTHIHKFYEDYLYQQAEKKFDNLLKFDIQSCFDSIYTHSIAWATNSGRDIYKRFFKGKDDETFGYAFDLLMQRMNYGETNGIVIGPEFSRIFSEIILQQVDTCVKRRLLKLGYKPNTDYLCYRYVDDYFFFYTDQKVKNEAMRAFMEELREYKLAISESKTKEFKHPFITEITIAKQGIDRLITDYLSFHNGQDAVLEEEEDMAENDEEGNVISGDFDMDKLKQTLNNKEKLFFRSNHFIAKYKAIISTAKVENREVVNYTLARIERKLLSVLNHFDKNYKRLSEAFNEGMMMDECAVKKSKLESMLADYLVQVCDVAFFLYSDCKRINTTLKVMNIMNKIIIYLENDYKKEDGVTIPRFTNVVRDVVFRGIQKEIEQVFRISRYDDQTPLESLFLLITIKSLRNKYCINQDVLDQYLGIKYDGTKLMKGVEQPDMNALVFMLLLYYYGNSDKYKKQRYALVEMITKRFRRDGADLRKKQSELVILLLDLLACPFLRHKDRRDMCAAMGVDETAQTEIENYLKKRKYMFTRWTNVNLTKELGAKVSLEVYS